MSWHIAVASVPVADFTAAADAELVGEADNPQAKAAVEAAKSLVASSLAGALAVNLVAAGQEEDSARNGHPFVQLTLTQADAPLPNDEAGSPTASVRQAPAGRWRVGPPVSSPEALAADSLVTSLVTDSP